MIKKKGIKWTKKVWAAVVSSVLGLFIAVGGAVTAIALTSRNDNVGGNLADAVLTGSGTQSSPYVIQSPADWATVVARSSSATNYTYAVLGGNIVANIADATYEKKFGNSTLNDGTEPYYYGALCVPANKYINLDLGRYKIDRNLTTSVPYGSVMVSFGHLIINGNATLNDTNGTRSADYLTVSNVSVTGGMLTGGNASNATYAGGLTVHGGETILKGGAIYNNNATGAYEGSGIGVTVGTSASNTGSAASVATFRMEGGLVCLNQSNSGNRDGGGIGTSIDGTLYMSGGDVCWNTTCGGPSAWGGGISTRAAAYVTGGKVRHNYSSGQGGGMAPHESTLSLSNFEISDNIAVGPSAIYLRGTGLSFNNCTITGNMSTSNTQAITTSSGSAVINMQGKIVLNNNYYQNASGVREAKSIWLVQDQTINITGKIASNSQIYLQMAAPGVFTSGFKTNSAGTTSDVWESNLSTYVVRLNASGECELGTAGIADAWNNSIKSSLANGGNLYSFSATDNWQAGTAGSFGGGVGYGTVNDTGSYTGNLRVPKGANISMNLNGKTIDRKLTSAIDNGYVLLVYGNLTITDTVGGGKFAGGNTKGNGGGIYVANGGTLTINGGTVSGNHALSFGGGIYIENGGTVNMYGGVITDNHADENGGGVYVTEGAVFNLHGSPAVKANKSKTNLTDNVFLPGSSLININGTVNAGTTDSYVGVTLDKGLGTCTKYVSGTVAESRFAADNDIEYMIQKNGNNINIVENTALTMAQKWQKTIEKAQANPGYSVRFDVTKSWVADTVGGSTSFGTGTAFKGGALLIPSNASITLNLLNASSLDRNLNGKTAVADGGVIWNEGNLRIRGNGRITGGNSTSNGGGINTLGTLIVQGVAVTGNTAQAGGGINVRNGNKDGAVSLIDCSIEQNVATSYGGGIAAAVDVNLMGKVVIRNNTLYKDGSVSSDNAYLGGNANKLVIAKALTDGSEIHLTAVSSRKATSNLGAGSLAAVEGVFHCDSSERVLNVVDGEAYIGIKTTEPEAATNPIGYDKNSHEAVKNKSDFSALVDTAYTVSVKKYKLTEDLADGETDNGVAVSLDDPLLLTDAGRYVLRFTLKDGYLWESGDNRGEEYLEVEVIINKAVATIVTAPEISGSVYYGEKVDDILFTNGVANCAATNENGINGTWKLHSKSGVIDRGATTLAYTFTPANESIAPYEGSIAISPVGYAVTVIETNIDGTERARQSINVDYKTDFTFAFLMSGVNRSAKFTAWQDGVEQEISMVLAANPGYTPFLFRTGDNRKVHLTNDSNLLKEIAVDRSFSIGYEANTDTKYTIYYMLPDSDNQYQGYTNRNDLDDAYDPSDEGSLVIRYGIGGLGQSATGGISPEGTTATRVTLVTDAGAPLMEFTNSNQYEIDWARTGNAVNEVIAGDGSTWVVVYLKGREYTITFEPNGANQVYNEDGSMVQFSFKKSYGTRIEPPVTDEQMVKGDGTSSTFLGWFTAAQGGVKVDFTDSLIVTKNETYYAQWRDNPFTINYNKQVKDPTYTAYSYDIENSMMTGGQDAIHYTYTGASGDQYDIKDAYFPIDWSACEENPTEYYTSPNRIYLASPSAVGFRFGGWYRVFRNEQGTITRSTMITYIERGTSGNIELYARWIPATVSVSFDANGDGANATSTLKSYTNMRTYGTLPTATRSGYKFMGWFTDKEAADAVRDVENEEDIIINDMVTANMTVALAASSKTLYAGWRPIMYSYSYSDNSDAGHPRGSLTVQKLDSDGEVIGEIAEGEDIEYGTKINIIVTPNSGYTIDSIKNGNTPIVNNVPRTVTNNIDINVTFVPQVFTIRYEYDGGRAVNGETSFIKRFSLETPNTYLPGCDDTSTQTDVARTGYNFINWKLLADDTALTDLDSVRARFDAEHPLRNITLVATWEAKTLHVFLHKQDGTGSDSVDPIEGTLKEDVTIPKVDRENYILLGWATKPNSNSIVVSVGTNPDADDYGIGTYTLKAEDYTGLDDEQSINNLYAVWHIAGAQAMILESPATNAVYSGKPFTITARPLFSYSQDPTIVLQYQWYKDGVPVGQRITRTIADVAELGVQKWVEVEYKVTNVSDSGIYECRLTATGNVGGSTYSSGTGEIEINITKAEYSNMAFEDASSTYNGEQQYKYVKYGVPKPDGTIDLDQTAQNYIQIGSDRNDWIGVRYTYTLDGNPVTEMKGAGVYEVTASFTVPSTSNYQSIPDHTCVFTINKLTITQINYSIVSVGDDGSETEVKKDGVFSFDNPYNKHNYKVIANPVGVFSGDEVTVGVTNNIQVNVGNYEAAIDGTLSGAQADNYILEVSVGGTQIYRILKGSHDISNITFDEKVTRTFDGELQEVYIVIDGKEVKDGDTFKDKNGYELTANYSLSYQANNNSYAGADADNTLNGGISAGEYVITVTFTDADIANFNALDDRTCTLTVEQRDFYTEYDRDTLLGSFKNTSVSFDPNATAKLFIDGKILADNSADVLMDFNDSTKFGLTYTYEKLSGASYAEIIKGTQQEIIDSTTFKGLKDSGYYRLTASIECKDEAILNNYKEFDDIVVDYTIAAGMVKSISVTLKHNAQFWYNEEFDKGNIERIVVTYAGTDSDGNVDPNAADTTETFEDAWVSGSLIYSGESGNDPANLNNMDLLVKFNHVGDYKVAVSFLGGVQDITVSVKQKISSVTEWQYSEDGINWEKLGTDGIEYKPNGYRFRAKFSCIDENGASETEIYTEATVSSSSVNSQGNYVLGARETDYTLVATNTGNYVFTDRGNDVTGALTVTKNTGVTAQWYYNGNKIEEVNIVYSGADFRDLITVKYDLGDGSGEKTLGWSKKEVLHAGEYTLSAPKLPDGLGGNNYELQGIEITVTVAPKVVTAQGAKWQYFTGEEWLDLPASLDYKGGKYNIQIVSEDENGNEVIIAVVGAPLNGGDDIEIRNAGNYRLRGDNSDYTLPANANSKDLIIQKKSLTVDWKYGDDNIQFVYDGNEQTLLGTVKGVGDDESEALIEVSGNAGTKATSYTATAALLGDFGDNYVLSNPTFAWSISKRNIELEWNSQAFEGDAKDKFGYTGNIQVPEITKTNIVEGEVLTIKVDYKKGTDAIEEINVVTVGTYTAVPTFDGAPDVLANYSFNNVEYTFNIIKSAPAITSVTYNEYRTTNVTYQIEAGEERGLREDKLVASFSGTPVAGKFVFIDAEGETGQIVSGKDIDLSQTSTGTVFNYRFDPEDKDNYNSYYGKITIMIVADGPVTGSDALLIDWRVNQYILGSHLSLDTGMRVYIKYASFYEEDGVRHGKLVEVDLANVTFYVQGYSGTAESYVVSESDIPSSGFGTKVLEAELRTAGKPEGYGTERFEGKTSFVVTKEIPIGISVNEDLSEYRTVWYVGETFNYSGMVFTLNYGNDKAPGTMYAESVSCEIVGLEGMKLSEASEDLEVVFSFLDRTTSIHIEVREREDLQIASYNRTGNLLAYEDGNEIDWESEYGIKLIEDGVEKTEIEGVTYSYVIRKDNAKGQRVYKVDAIGTYYVEVQFLIENPRYKNYDGQVVTLASFELQVSEVVYNVDPNYSAFTEEELHVQFKGDAFGFDTTRQPVVYDKSGVVVAPRNVRVTYSYNGETDPAKWNIIHVGEYTINVTIEVNDPKLGWRLLRSEDHTVEVRQATTVIDEFTIGQADSNGVYFIMQGADVKEAIKLNSNFGKDTATYRYRLVGTTAWSNGLPTVVGKYEVEASIRAEAITGDSDHDYSDYGAAEPKTFVFEIRSGSIKNEVEGGGSVEIIDGSNGIGSGVKLDVKKVTEEDLTGIKVRKQNVLDGYDVNLVAGDVTVQPNGDVTVKVKLGSEFDGRTDLNVYLYGEDGKATKLEAEVDEDGYVVFTTRQLGRILITESVVTAPGGLIAGVSIGAIVAAALIVACVLVFLKKRSK